jgi:hypothetical protein
MLGSVRRDRGMTKGRGRFHLYLMLDDSTAGPSTTLRSGRDDKGEGSDSICISCWMSQQQVPPLRFAPVGMTIHFGKGAQKKLSSR